MSERPRKTLDLGPFHNDPDTERKYDLIRGLVIFMAARAHPNKDRTAIAG